MPTPWMDTEDMLRSRNIVCFQLDEAPKIDKFIEQKAEQR
jgi:hypothetical protein